MRVVGVGNRKRIKDFGSALNSEGSLFGPVCANLPPSMMNQDWRPHTLADGRARYVNVSLSARYISGPGTNEVVVQWLLSSRPRSPTSEGQLQKYNKLATAELATRELLMRRTHEVMKLTNELMRVRRELMRTEYVIIDGEITKARGNAPALPPVTQPGHSSTLSTHQYAELEVDPAIVREIERALEMLLMNGHWDIAANQEGGSG
jgi:hypothetical protein